MSFSLVKVAKFLFTNIQKQQHTLKSSLLFKKNANFTGDYLENYKDLECEVFRVMLSYKHEHIGRFSNLHWYTFKTIACRHEYLSKRKFQKL